MSFRNPTVPSRRSDLRHTRCSSPRERRRQCRRHLWPAATPGPAPVSSRRVHQSVHRPTAHQGPRTSRSPNVSLGALTVHEPAIRSTNSGCRTRCSISSPDWNNISEITCSQRRPLTLRTPRHRLTADANPSAVRFVQTRQTGEQRRFTGTPGSRDRHHLTGPDAQRDTPQCKRFVIASEVEAEQLACLQRWNGGGDRCRPQRRCHRVQPNGTGNGTCSGPGRRANVFSGPGQVG